MLRQARRFQQSNGKAILTASSGPQEEGDDIVRLWDGGTGRPIARLRQRWGIGAVAFSPNGKTVLTGGEDFTARLWKTDTGEPLGKALQHQDVVQAVAFSPDGRQC